MTDKLKTFHSNREKTRNESTKPLTITLQPQYRKLVESSLLRWYIFLADNLLEQMLVILFKKKNTKDGCSSNCQVYFHILPHSLFISTATDQPKEFPRKMLWLMIASL